MPGAGVAARLLAGLYALPDVIRSRALARADAAGQDVDNLGETVASRFFEEESLYASILKYAQPSHAALAASVRRPDPTTLVPCPAVAPPKPWDSSKHRPCRSWSVIIPGCDGCHMDRDCPVKGGKAFTPRAGRGSRGHGRDEGRGASPSPRSVHAVTPAPAPHQAIPSLAAQDFTSLFDAHATVGATPPSATPPPTSVCVAERIEQPSGGLYEPHVQPSWSPPLSLPLSATCRTPEQRVERSHLCEREALPPLPGGEGQDSAS